MNKFNKKGNSEDFLGSGNKSATLRTSDYSSSSREKLLNLGNSSRHSRSENRLKVGDSKKHSETSKSNLTITGESKVPSFLKNVVKRRLKISSKKVLNLISSFNNDDLNAMQKKLNNFIGEVTGADSVFLMHPTEVPNQVQVSVIDNYDLNDIIKFSVANSSFQDALERCHGFTTEDIRGDHCHLISYLIKKPIKSFLCVPIADPYKARKAYLLVCLVNKKSVLSPLSNPLKVNRKNYQKALIAISEFTEDDHLVIYDVFNFCTPVFYKTIHLYREKEIKEKCQSLLNSARNLIKHMDNPPNLLKEMMKDAKKLTKAERCSVFLVDKQNKQLVATIFEGLSKADDKSPPAEIRMPLDQGIAGYVATKGTMLNIKDAYSHPLFYKKIDELTNFKTRCILCFPIKHDNETVAVAQLCNKTTSLYFTAIDQEMAHSFSVYCAVTIVYAKMWSDVREAYHRNKLSNELLMYHLGVSDTEVEELSKENIESHLRFDPNFDRFVYNPRTLEEKLTLPAGLYMFDTLNFMQDWNIPMEILAKFLIMVKKGYRDPPYHNWRHAFSVAHFCYLLLVNLNIMETHLSNIQGFVLLVSAFCHDLDHRGTNNSFQTTAKSELAGLYSSEGSVLERHHLSQAMTILHSEGCNVFDCMNRQEYSQALDLMKDIILSTDLAHHFAILPDIKKMVAEGYEYYNMKHRELLLSLIITSCDLNDQTKNWAGVRIVAENIYTEFFRQGDLEKSLGNNPLEMMDRDKAFIPDLQIGFLDNVINPLYSQLIGIFPALNPLYFIISKNKSLWGIMKELIDSKYQLKNSFELFSNKNLEIEMDEIAASLESHDWVDF